MTSNCVTLEADINFIVKQPTVLSPLFYDNLVICSQVLYFHDLVHF